MSAGSNGQQIVIPSYQPRSVAELSSQERSRLLDALIAQHNRMGQAIEAQGRQITVLAEAVQAIGRRLDEHGQQSYLFMARPFLARLGWVFRGR